MGKTRGAREGNDRESGDYPLHYAARGVTLEPGRLPLDGAAVQCPCCGFVDDAFLDRFSCRVEVVGGTPLASAKCSGCGDFFDLIVEVHPRCRLGDT